MDDYTEKYIETLLIASMLVSVLCRVFFCYISMFFHVGSVQSINCSCILYFFFSIF